jgi:hypothetical protein
VRSAARRVGSGLFSSDHFAAGHGKPLSIEGKGSDVLIAVTWRNEKERPLLRLIKNGNKNMLEYRAVP